MESMASAVVVEGRRERKKRETRHALRKAALELTLARGPENVSVEEIADAADVSVRTFFNYFPSKDESLVAWDRELRAEVADVVRSRPAEEAPLQAIKQAMRETFEGICEIDERALRMRLVREYPSLLPHHLAAHAELERALAAAVADRLGIDADDEYPALVVTCAVAAMRVAVNSWENQGRRPRLGRLLDECFDALAAGLAPPTSRKRR